MTETDKETQRIIDLYGGIEYWLEEEGAHLMEIGSRPDQPNRETFDQDGKLLMEASRTIIYLRKQLKDKKDAI